MTGWRYYNHAMIPTCAPHEQADIASVEDGSIWLEKDDNKPFVARWTSNFDCGYETDWWYCIKDKPFDINAISSKKRYEINKGIKNFDVRVIDPGLYKNELYNIIVAAYITYPKAYRPTVNKADLFKSIDNWNCITFGAFCRENDQLCGFAQCAEYDSYLAFSVCKTIPIYEKFAINAAIVNGIIEKYNYRLGHEFYIVDGERNISHVTQFQDYLEKYFGFRKAYCELHVVYRRGVRQVINLLFPFRKILCRVKKGKLVHQINSILLMEEIARKFKR